MAQVRMTMLGLAALAACAASFWCGRYFSKGGVPAMPSQASQEMPPDEPQNSSSTFTPSSDGPTCSLTPSDLEAQRKQLIPGLFQSADKVEDVADGLRFHFAHKANLVTELATLIEKERVCCSFLSFRLITKEAEGPITLEVTGPTGTADMLRKL